MSALIQSFDPYAFTQPQFQHALAGVKAGNGRFLCEIASGLKEHFRKRYFDVENRFTPHDHLEALRRSQRFWTLYETINRVLDPLDPTYSIVNSGVALSTTADNLTFQAASAGQGRVLEIIIGGEATASAINRVAVQRAGTSITSNTAITPEKFNSRSAAAAGTYGKAGTQTLVGNPMLPFAFNAFGGFIRWVPAPGEELYYVNSEVISIRSLTGTSTVSSCGVFEEL